MENGRPDLVLICSIEEALARPRRRANSDAVLNQESSPWLMLPPKYEGRKSSYKLYNLADNKVQTLCGPIDEIRDLALINCRGSSHGWLALLGPFDSGFFLYNPISRRHIKLPSIRNLPNTFRYYGVPVKNVILSCSPEDDEENFRVVIMRYRRNAMAFCWPGRSKEWTLMLDENRGKSFYIDCVYSARLKLFFALTNDRKLEAWDLGDPSYPKLIKVDDVDMDQYCYLSSIERLSKISCGRVGHLVVADEALLLVIQYIMNHVGPDGSCFDRLDKRRPNCYSCRYMTIGFDIFKYDSEKGKFKNLDSSSLGGLAIFVGKHCHSVAIQATEFPGVKPNSVYFTDGYHTENFDSDHSSDDDDDDDDDELFCGGGQDIGIYSYIDKTVSPMPLSM
ncbi:hypothetical protein CASFOL_026554 [Castilleja foliolosa]|uniref:KIB1-4 beta-propeller domain-containing protein n=1 Tax=Castilleja foliolosa TaxID=1961234 RepID=A0ABD3CIM8_9LAMI